MADANEIIVNSYYGKYDANMKKVGFPSESLEGPVTEKWITPKPKRNYHIGVLFPHLKDSYWITANYGIFTHAKEIGVKITLYSAGAYIRFGDQREQLGSLAKKTKVDGIILASVDYAKMDRFVAEVTDSGVPVIALINDITAPQLNLVPVFLSIFFLLKIILIYWCDYGKLDYKRKNNDFKTGRCIVEFIIFKFSVYKCSKNSLNWPKVHEDNA